MMFPLRYRNGNDTAGLIDVSAWPIASPESLMSTSLAKIAPGTVTLVYVPLLKRKGCARSAGVGLASSNEPTTTPALFSARGVVRPSPGTWRVANDPVL